MDALELLTQQHREAKDLFKQIEQTEDPKQGRQLFDRLKAKLQLHEDLEERLLYPRLKAEEAFTDEVLESYQEHHVMDVLLREISGLTMGSEDFHPKVKVLEENTLHHAEEEEEGKLFPQVRKAWSTARLQEIGLEMEGLMRQEEGARKAA